MAYYLAVETNPGEYTALKLKKLKEFGALKDDQKPCECTLEEIEWYTTQFTSSKSLTQRLASNTILSYRDLTKQLAIFYVNGIETRKVKGNILYKDDLDYFEKPMLVFKYIINKGKEKDGRFFRELIQTQENTSIITYMLAKLAITLEQQQNYNKGILLDELNKTSLSKNIDEFIDNVATALLYECYLDEYGSLKYQIKVSLEKLHTIISFINEYEKKYPKEKTTELTKKRKPHRK